MKLILSIISDEDVRDVQEALRKNNFYSTKLATTGGFLAKGNSSLIIGLENDKVDKALEIIKENSKTRSEYTTSGLFPQVGYPLEVKVGGATVFVIDVEQFYKF